MRIITYHFWSPTCGPCKVIKPSIESLKEEFPQATWVSVNTHEDNNNIVKQFGVQVVPTIVVAVFNDDDKLVSAEKHSGTNISSYYRILRNAMRFIQQ